MIRAVILAAGESKRMGTPKLLLPYGEKTIVEIVVESVVSSKVDETFVILGSGRESIEEKIKDFPVIIVFNPDFHSGMLSSVQCGFQAVPEDTRAVLVVLGDQPATSKDVIDALVEAYQKTGKGIVLPVYEKERGHPVIMDVKYKQEVLGLSPDVGLRGTVYSHPEDILEVVVDSPDILQDIDNPVDYERELKKKK